VARALVYLALTLGPFGLLLGGRRLQRRGPVADLLRGAVPGGLLATVATFAGGFGVAAAAWTGVLALAYGWAWCGIWALLGRQRVAVLVLACLVPLPVATTFAPNAVVEDRPGELVHTLAPTVLVHLNPVVVIGTRFLDDPVLVTHYFYHQARAPVPPAWRVLVLYLGVGALGLLRPPPRTGPG
jgi:hypothetical protein